MSPIGSTFEVVSLEESRQLPYFMLIDDTDMHTLIEAVNFSIQFYQSKLGEILRERIARLERGEANVIDWKADTHDKLLHTIDRLDTFGDKLRALPTARECDQA